MKTLVEKTDFELKSDVLAELKYEPTVNIADIGVLVREGTVTLNGYASSYGEKWNALAATKRVAGVRGIADDIVVKTSLSSLRTDGDIAGEAINQIGYLTSIPKGAVRAIVSDGWLTLEGSVDEGYQRNSVQNYVQFLASVKGVTNLIKVTNPQIAPETIKSSIESAFERSAQLDAEKIQVEASGSKVTLRGKVRNYAERDEAERVAWAASGVWSVDNRIEVKWSWGFEG